MTSTDPEIREAEAHAGRVQYFFRRLVLEAGLEGKVFHAQKTSKAERQQIKHIRQRAESLAQTEKIDALGSQPQTE